MKLRKNLNYKFSHLSVQSQKLRLMNLIEFKLYFDDVNFFNNQKYSSSLDILKRKFY